MKKIIMVLFMLSVVGFVSGNAFGDLWINNSGVTETSDNYDVKITDELEVGGDVDITGNATIGDDTDIAGDLTVGGSVYVDDDNGNLGKFYSGWQFPFYFEEIYWPAVYLEAKPNLDEESNTALNLIGGGGIIFWCNYDTIEDNEIVNTDFSTPIIISDPDDTTGGWFPEVYVTTQLNVMDSLEETPVWISPEKVDT